MQNEINVKLYGPKNMLNSFLSEESCGIEYLGYNTDEFDCEDYPKYCMKFKFDFDYSNHLKQMNDPEAEMHLPEKIFKNMLFDVVLVFNGYTITIEQNNNEYTITIG